MYHDQHTLVAISNYFTLVANGMNSHLYVLYNFKGGTSCLLFFFLKISRFCRNHIILIHHQYAKT